MLLSEINIITVIGINKLKLNNAGGKLKTNTRSRNGFTNSVHSLLSRVIGAPIPQVIITLVGASEDRRTETYTKPTGMQLGIARYGGGLQNS